MRRVCLAGVWAAAVALGGGVADGQPTANKDRAKLDGTWEGFVVDGKGEQPNRGPLKLRLVISGNKMTGTDLNSNREIGDGTFTLDAGRKVLDANGIVLSAGKVNRTYLGIYEVNGDTLKWCVSNHQAKTRPDTFATKTPQFYMILKRQKS